MLLSSRVQGFPLLHGQLLGPHLKKSHSLPSHSLQSPVALQCGLGCRESFLICACISVGLVLHRTRDSVLASVNACVQWPCRAWKMLFHNGHLLALKIFPLPFLKRERRLGGRGCAIGVPFKTECSTFSIFWPVARLWIYSRLVQKGASLMGMRSALIYKDI